MNKKTKMALRLGLVAVGVGLVLSLACSDDDGGDEDNTPNPTATVSAAAQPQTVEVIGADYNFKNLPQTVAVGSKLTFTNESDKELHEMVVIRINDDEKRPVSELLQLPEEEIAQVSSAEPAMVYVAMPNEDGEALLGDGTLKQAGRYAVICFIPTGADPEAFMAAANAGGDEPPEIEGGPPHAINGMFGEITVR